MQKQPLLLPYLNLIPTPFIQSIIPSNIPPWQTLPLDLLVLISNKLDIPAWKNFRLLGKRFLRATKQRAKTSLPVVLKNPNIVHEIKTFLSSGRNKARKSKKIQTRNSFQRVVVHTIAQLYDLYTRTTIDHSNYHINVNSHKYFNKYKEENPQTPFSFVEISRIPFDEKRIVLGQPRTIFYNKRTRYYGSDSDW